jgi:hypothetical protein
MDATKEQLAKALAKAVKDQVETFEIAKETDWLYTPPDWFPDAVTALAAYSAEQDLEKNQQQY